MSACQGVIEAHAIRVALANAGGVPQAGAENGFVSDAITNIAVQLNYEGSSTVTSFKGSGELCQVKRNAGRPTTGTFETELCRLENPLKALVVGGKLLGDTDLGGYDAPQATDDIVYSIWEIWTASWDGTVQKVDASGNLVWTVFVAPLVTVELGQEQTDRENFMVTPMTATAVENPSLPLTGPFGDWPAYVGTDGGIEGIFGHFETTSIPTAACELIEVPAVY